MSALPGADPWEYALHASAVEYPPLDALWEAEIVPIRWLQGLGDWLALPLGVLTHLGSQSVIIVVLAVVFWCFDSRSGARLFVVVAASGMVNYLCKSLLYGARPSWFDAHVKAHADHGSFGIPSGHTQGAMVTWGYLGLRSGRRVMPWVAVAVIALVSFSRVYLGAHFISDVAAGLLLGAAVLWAALRWEDRIARWWSGLTTVRWVGCALAVTLLPCLVAALWQSLVLGSWEVPAEWIGAAPTDPAGHTLTGLYTVSGALLGGIVGFTLLAGRGWYSAQGTVVSKIARFVLGISVVVLIQAVMDVFFGATTGLSASVVSFVAYAAITFWASYVAPELFVRSGLARRPDPSRASVSDAPDGTGSE